MCNITWLSKIIQTMHQKGFLIFSPSSQLLNILYFPWKWKVKVLVAQSCMTLCNPVECSPPGSSVHGILQAGLLKWVAISFSRGPSWPRDQIQVSCTAGRFITFLATKEALYFPYMAPFLSTPSNFQNFEFLCLSLGSHRSRLRDKDSVQVAYLGVAGTTGKKGKMIYDIW